MDKKAGIENGLVINYKLKGFVTAIILLRPISTTITNNVMSIFGENHIFNRY